MMVPISADTFMYPSAELKKQMQGDIHTRLKKIAGQIRGLQGMIAADKDCEQILT
jgi:DNA-binding FrmR family transcriptional regulator